MERIDKNFVVINEHYRKDIQDLIFDCEPVAQLESNKTMIDVLVEYGIFKSRGDAKKNWTKGIEIPFGFSDFNNIGKFRHRFCIWKPVAD